MRLEHGRLNRLPERKITVQRCKIGMVFQQLNLYQHMTAPENIIEQGPSEAVLGAPSQPRTRSFPARFV